jgi:hypothetical protein
MRHLGALLLGIILTVSSTSAAPQQVELDVVSWRVSLLGRGIAGQALLVSIPEDGWRLAVSRYSPGVTSLLAETGDGWTFIGGPEGRVWLNEWRGPSREISSPLASTLQAIVEACDDPALLLQRVTVPQSKSDDSWAESVSNEYHPPTLRDRLSSRATGRAGPEETLMIRPKSDDNFRGVKVVSRRRHGLLDITVTDNLFLLGDPADILMPVWPLAELLTEPAPE